MNAVPAAGAPSLEPAVQHRKTVLLYQSAATAQAVNIVNGGLLAYVNTRLGIEPTVALLWWCALTLVATGRYLLARRFAAVAPDILAAPDWRRRYLVGTALAGATWGAGMVAFILSGDDAIRLFSGLVIAGMVAGAMPILGAVPAAFRLFAVPAVLPMALVLVIRADSLLDVAFGVMCLAYLAAMLNSARHMHGTLDASIRLALEKQGLVDDLDEARQAAEEANRLKSRMLAAASHDLRQPIHALGMFSARLGDIPHPPPVAELVSHIGESVEGVSALLDSLFDLSKIESGQIRADPVRFPMQDLLQRLDKDYSALAARHGLRFSVRAMPAWVASDPVLLERILRNLVANAIRYTPRGGVVLGCRRRGAALRIEVWDSGYGIPAESQQAIFGEFVQAGVPAPARAKGLGLGLFIVERTARLLGHPIGVRSRPGSGSMFHVTVPLADGPAETSHMAPAGRLPALTVLIIDDDRSVRLAMQELIEGWGCRCIATASCDEALARVEHASILLCDYQLSERETGFDAIRRLRERFGADLPAVVMTGETSPAVAQRAEELRLPLLYKPVRPARLRTLLSRVADERPDAAPRSP